MAEERMIRRLAVGDNTEGFYFTVGQVFPVKLPDSTEKEGIVVTSIERVFDTDTPASVYQVWVNVRGSVVVWKRFENQKVLIEYSLV